MKIFVEGGGNSKQLKILCRRGFSKFLENSGIRGSMPGIVSSGSRENAYKDYNIAIDRGIESMLLVDSESEIAQEVQAGDPLKWDPWKHLGLSKTSKWKKPNNANVSDCHLMVQCMESWFLADKETMRAYFGNGFGLSALPSDNNIEMISKDDIFSGLSKATMNCKKSRYHKGEHSFEILRLIDPRKVINASPWAKRFVDHITYKMKKAR